MVWIIDSVVDHTINISKYNPLAGSSYIKLPKELNYPRKGLINVQNIDEMKALNGICSNTSILQIIIQKELQKLIKILTRDFVLKT